MTLKGGIRKGWNNWEINTVKEKSQKSIKLAKLKDGNGKSRKTRKNCEQV